MMTIEDEILDYLRVEPETELSTRDLSDLTGATMMQTRGALNRLRSRGKVGRSGNTRAARWWLEVTP